jgi:DNA mismatch endonuclease (patch repair protein)
MKRVVLREKLRIKAPRPPKASSAAVSKSMKGNKATGTKPELLFRKALKDLGIKGARWNPPEIPGRPDAYFPAPRLAVFVNGCFWHRCKKCGYELPKANRSYWRLKFLANVLRDQKKRRRLNSLKIHHQTYWECEIAGSQEKVAGRLAKLLQALT